MRTAEGTPEKALRTPRAAGVAGILCALVLAAAIVLIRIALPAGPAGSAGRLTGSAHRDTLQVVLNLVPFAGVFFLWFMGVVRDRVGKAEDRFFATLFLGSGLLFVAMLFVLASAADSVLAVTDPSRAAGPPPSWQYGRHLTIAMLSSYSTRMAAVFTVSTTTIGRQLGIFPRWLAWLGYLAAFYLMFLASVVPWSELVFPVWILAVSCLLLLADRRSPGARDTP
ncbi:MULTISPECIES: hypothetical protein [Kitasatospora]|uniref:DUF4386 family protein n=1 Tax=Kitasatospora cystarginea TaxID=58350 RepID=A0ABN3DFA1_9ACTN